MGEFESGGSVNLARIGGPRARGPVRAAGLGAGQTRRLAGRRAAGPGPQWGPRRTRMMRRTSGLRARRIIRVPSC